MKRRLFTLLMAAVMLLSLTACGKEAAPTTEPTTVPTTEPPMDAQTLLANMTAAAESKPATTMKMEMDMDIGMDFTSMGMSMTMNMDMTMDMKMDSAAQTYYTDMDMNMSVMGEVMSEKMQTYVLSEDGTVVTYTYNETNGTWTRQETPDALGQEDMTQFLKAFSADLLTLEENTQQLGGREVYVLHGTMSGASEDMDMSALEDILSGLGTDVSGMDLSQIEVPVTMYVDAETFLIVQYEMEMAGMEEMMNVLIQSLLGSMEDTEELDMAITIEKFSMVAADIGYEKVEVPQVPAEGIQRADIPAYTIEESDVSVTVFVPQEYALMESDYYYIGLVNGDETQYVYYSLYTDAEFTEFFGEGDLAGFGYTNGSESLELNGFKTLSASDGDMNIYIAWIQVGDCKLVVDSYDYFSDSTPETILPQLLEAVFSSQLVTTETL